MSLDCFVLTRPPALWLTTPFAPVVVWVGILTCGRALETEPLSYEIGRFEDALLF